MDLENSTTEEKDFDVFDPMVEEETINSEESPEIPKESSTKKALKAVGRGAAAYATGGESLGMDKDIANMPTTDRLLGVVADTADKIPGVKGMADELDEAGVSDLANDAMDLAGDIKEGDLSSLAESSSKVKEDVKKTRKFVKKKLIIPIAISVGSFCFLLIIVLAICGPILGGFINVTDDTGYGDVEASDTNPSIDGNNIQLGDIFTDFSSLSDTRQAILSAGASVLGRKYNWGGHPTAGGLNGFPNNGVDCAGYVQWVLWTALGENPGYLTTASISDLIGSKFIEISPNELLPGDIGLKFKGVSSKSQNHTGIYAGNGVWMHAKGAKYGIVRGAYSGFTVFLRYVGVS